MAILSASHYDQLVVGTYGYADPEYIETGHLTTKSDVWSFGVVLYEILSGRRSLERNRPKTEQKLLDWVKEFPHESKRFTMIMDPRLNNQYPVSAARQIAKLAESCLCKSRNDRPKMSEVVESLKKALELSEIPESSRPYQVNFNKKQNQVTIPRESAIEVSRIWFIPMFAGCCNLRCL
ncbi:hypothetical protein GIB67_015343 [Kingdonia uniflora]|uniref:Protein kinase domain-containing protein n=1 Tax=Kingdonia uniflora TaxID=39325 RepID=A0A7J7KYP1_9MAGN|nr:hypothetical protein GIB67_015343 [Kingdonia uniflora]